MTTIPPDNSLAGRFSSRTVRVENDIARVLVVDDNESGARATGARLAADGYAVETALGGIQALEVLQDWTPHIILLDINMPEFDGFDVAAMVRKIGAISHVGIIAMTGYDEYELRKRGSLAAFDGFFRRGECDDQLITLLEAMLDREGSCLQSSDQ
nr:response regulator [Caballeronia sp. BR00000012568055]